MKKRKTPDLEKYLEGKKRRFVNYTPSRTHQTARVCQGAEPDWNH